MQESCKSQMARHKHRLDRESSARNSRLAHPPPPPVSPPSSQLLESGVRMVALALRCFSCSGISRRKRHTAKCSCMLETCSTMNTREMKSVPPFVNPRRPCWEEQVGRRISQGACQTRARTLPVVLDNTDGRKARALSRHSLTSKWDSLNIITPTLLPHPEAFGFGPESGGSFAQGKLQKMESLAPAFHRCCSCAEDGRTLRFQSAKSSSPSVHSNLSLNSLAPSRHSLDLVTPTHLPLAEAFGFGPESGGSFAQGKLQKMESLAPAFHRCRSCADDGRTLRSQSLKSSPPSARSSCKPTPHVLSRVHASSTRSCRSASFSMESRYTNLHLAILNGGAHAREVLACRGELPLLLSGASDGADTLFGIAAARTGHEAATCRPIYLPSDLILLHISPSLLPTLSRTASRVTAQLT